jgi:hypothetical protein
MLEKHDRIVRKLITEDNKEAVLHRLVRDKLLSETEAAVINMRVATVRLDQRVTTLLKKTKDWYDAG